MYKIVRGPHLESCGSNLPYFPPRYRVGGWVFPTVPYSRLYVFETLEDARHFYFAQCDDDLKIFECETEDARPVPIVRGESPEEILLL